MAFGDIATLRDNFNRPDESPLTGGGRWLGKMDTRNTATMKVVSSQAATSSGAADARYSPAPLAADYETYVTSAATATQIFLYLRMIDPGTATPSGYHLSVTFNTDNWVLFRYDGGAPSLLANVTFAVAPGDKIGLAIMGTTIEGWINTGGGWGLVFQRVNSAYLAPGVVGAGGNNAGADQAVFDDFYFGEIMVQQSLAPPMTGRARW